MADPIQPRDGEIAYAISVGTLYDLTVGKVGWPVRFTRHSSPTDPTLTLANRTPGGPILNVVKIIVNPDSTITTIPVFTINEGGIDQMKVGGFLDLAYQPTGTPDAPGAGTDTLRMYSRGGQLYFKAEDSAEQPIPIGEAAGSGLRWSFWMGGG